MLLKATTSLASVIKMLRKSQSKDNYFLHLLRNMSRLKSKTKQRIWFQFFDKFLGEIIQSPRVPAWQFLMNTTSSCIYNESHMLSTNTTPCPNFLTSFRIVSARCSILNILPTNGAKDLCHSRSSFLSKFSPSSMRMAAIFAALKQVELMDCNPLTRRNSSIPCNELSHP